MRSTTIKEVGPYYLKLNVGDDWSMVFTEADNVPFYLPNNHCLHRKYHRKTCEQKIVSKTKKNIKKELKEKERTVRGHCWRDNLKELARKNTIELTYKTDVIEEGGIWKPKDSSRSFGKEFGSMKKIWLNNHWRGGVSDIWRWESQARILMLQPTYLDG